jgi:hypothetical protein
LVYNRSEQALVPTLNPGVVIMAWCGRHKGPGVRQASRTAGAKFFSCRGTLPGGASGLLDRFTPIECANYS